MNATYDLLREYAEHHNTASVSGTVKQLTWWYADRYGVKVSERTFKRHTRKLADAGLIDVQHRRQHTTYVLSGFKATQYWCPVELDYGSLGVDVDALEAGWREPDLVDTPRGLAPNPLHEIGLLDSAA